MARKNIGPGPGKYVLPPVTGYTNHDVSKYRNPQFSIGTKLMGGKKPFGPGPRYDIHNMTRYGKATPAAYSMKSRPKPLALFPVPGPGTYKNEKVPRMKEPRPPIYSMSYRHPPLKKAETPGPDKYEVPTTLGPKVPDIHANAAYSMSYKHFLPTLERSPGPAKYTGTSTNVYRNKLPDYTISPRIFPPDPKIAAPGPIYFPKVPQKPGYSFGLRTVTEPYISAEDDMPCTRKQKTC